MFYFINIFKQKTNGTYSINIPAKIVEKQICCSLPNNNKSNPFINLFKMPIKLNSVEQTAEPQ